MTELRFASATHIGRVRPDNKDGILAAQPLFAVADGLGVGGEVACALALEVLGREFGHDPTRTGLINACEVANREVCDRAATTEGLKGMGTTLTAVAFIENAAGGPTALSVGDSRLYQFRGRELHQLTVEHSVVGQLIQSGRMTEAEGRLEPKSLTQALGKGPSVDPDIVSMDLKSGDRLLVCTDGLFMDVPEMRIGEILTQPDLGIVANSLVEEADVLGGRDNTSVIVIDIT